MNNNTPETDAEENFLEANDLETGLHYHYVRSDFARRLERQRNEARNEINKIKSCIDQGIDFYQVHRRDADAFTLKNLLENINERLNG